jgi:hypothetical protein
MSAEDLIETLDKLQGALKKSTTQISTMAAQEIARSVVQSIPNVAVNQIEIGTPEYAALMTEVQLGIYTGGAQLLESIKRAIGRAVTALQNNIDYKVKSGQSRYTEEDRKEMIDYQNDQAMLTESINGMNTAAATSLLAETIRGKEEAVAEAIETTTQVKNIEAHERRLKDITDGRIPPKLTTPREGAGTGATDSEPDPNFVPDAVGIETLVAEALERELDPTEWPDITETDKYMVTSIVASTIAGLTGVNPYSVYLGTQAGTRLIRYVRPIIYRLARSNNVVANGVGNGLLNSMATVVGLPSSALRASSAAFNYASGAVDSLTGIENTLGSVAADVGKVAADVGWSATEEFLNLPQPVQFGVAAVVGGAVAYGFYSQVVSPLMKWLNGREAVKVLGVETVELMKKEVTKSVKAMNVLKGAFGQGDAAKVYVGQASGAAIGRRKIRNSRAADVVSPYSGNHVMYAGYSIVGYAR